MDGEAGCERTTEECDKILSPSALKLPSLMGPVKEKVTKT